MNNAAYFKDLTNTANQAELAEFEAIYNKVRNIELYKSLTLEFDKQFKDRAERGYDQADVVLCYLKSWALIMKKYGRKNAFEYFYLALIYELKTHGFEVTTPTNKFNRLVLNVCWR